MLKACVKQRGKKTDSRKNFIQWNSAYWWGVSSLPLDVCWVQWVSASLTGEQRSTHLLHLFQQRCKIHPPELETLRLWYPAQVLFSTLLQHTTRSRCQPTPGGATLRAASRAPPHPGWKREKKLYCRKMTDLDWGLNVNWEKLRVDKRQDGCCKRDPYLQPMDWTISWHSCEPAIPAGPKAVCKQYLQGHSAQLCRFDQNVKGILKTNAQL